MRGCIAAALVLVACGGAPASAPCRSNLDCPSETVCIAGQCVGSPGGDTGVADTGALDTGASDTGMRDVDTGVPRLDAATDTGTGPLPGETCGNPILLTPVDDGTGAIVATWHGHLGDYADDDYADCGDVLDMAHDVIFEIARPTDTANHDIVITTSPSSLDTIMGIDDRCDRFAWVCNDDRNPTGMGSSDVSSGIFLWHFAARHAAHLYMIVEGSRASVTGDVDVRVEVRAPAGIACDASALDVSGGGSVLAFGSPAVAVDQGNCATTRGGDVAFSVGTITRLDRAEVQSSDLPVSLRLTHGSCVDPASLCAVPEGTAGYFHSAFFGVDVGGPAFIVVEGITPGMDADFQLDIDP